MRRQIGGDSIYHDRIMLYHNVIIKSQGRVGGFPWRQASNRQRYDGPEPAHGALAKRDLAAMALGDVAGYGEA